jgi:hypothetical protein
MAKEPMVEVIDVSRTSSFFDIKLAFNPEREA